MNIDLNYKSTSDFSFDEKNSTMSCNYSIININNLF